ncbi:hypothetical protein [Burkholderia pyrrocinia]
MSTGIRSKLHLVKNSYVKFRKVIDILNFDKSDKSESSPSRRMCADIKNVRCDTTSATNPREEVSRIDVPESSQPTTEFGQQLKAEVKKRQTNRMLQEVMSPSEETVTLLAEKIKQLPAWDKALAMQQSGNPDQQNNHVVNAGKGRTSHS